MILLRLVLATFNITSISHIHNKFLMSKSYAQPLNKLSLVAITLIFFKGVSGFNLNMIVKLKSIWDSTRFKLVGSYYYRWHNYHLNQLFNHWEKMHIKFGKTIPIRGKAWTQILVIKLKGKIKRRERHKCTTDLATWPH